MSKSAVSSPGTISVVPVDTATPKCFISRVRLAGLLVTFLALRAFGSLFVLGFLCTQSCNMISAATDKTPSGGKTLVFCQMDVR